MTDQTYQEIAPDLARRVWKRDVTKRLAIGLNLTWQSARTYLRDGLPKIHRDRFASLIESEIAAAEAELLECRKVLNALRGDQ